MRACETRAATFSRCSYGPDGARLAALCDLGILDAAPDKGFDRVMRLASELIEAPVSLVSLLDRDRQFVLQAILAIGDGMDIQVVAEGIEPQRQRELLCLSGCPFGQGFLFARPPPAEEIVVGRRPQEPMALRGHEAWGTTIAASPTV